MFEKIVLRHSPEGPATTLGLICEAMLYYQNVHLVLDHGTLIGLVTQAPIERLLAILARPGVSAVYCNEHLAAYNDGPRMRFVAMSFAGTKERMHKNRADVVENVLVRHAAHSQKRARAMAEKFCTIVPTRSLARDDFLKGGIPTAARKDLLDASFVEEAIRRMLQSELGERYLPSDLIFQVQPFDAEQFTVETNLNFDLLNVQRAPDSKLTVPMLVNHILTATGDMTLAAYYGGDFQASDISSIIVRLKHDELLRRSGINDAARHTFREVALEGRSLRAVIDSGARSLDEFLKLLDSADRFRDWLKHISPDEQLVREYIAELSRKGWLETLPARGVRFVLSTLAGLIGPATGLAVSAADAFFLDRVAGGWRPSHFVEKRLKSFVASAD